MCVTHKTHIIRERKLCKSALFISSSVVITHVIDPTFYVIFRKNIIIIIIILNHDEGEKLLAHYFLSPVHRLFQKKNSHKESGEGSE